MTVFLYGMLAGIGVRLVGDGAAAAWRRRPWT